MSWNGKNILYSGDFSEEDKEKIIDSMDREHSMRMYSGSYSGKSLLLMLFDPLSYLGSVETHFLLGKAMSELGGIYQLWEAKGSSMEKGESKLDTLRIAMGYSEILAIRDSSTPISHYIEMMTKNPANGVVMKPIINAGDIRENPIHTIADLYQQKRKGLFDNIEKYRLLAAKILIAKLLDNAQK